MAFGAINGLIAYSDESGAVYVCDGIRGEVKCKFEAHKSGVTGLCFAPKCDSIMSIGEDEAIRFWDPVHGKELQKEGRGKGHLSRVLCVAQSPRTMQVCSGSRDGTVIVWDTKTHAPVGLPFLHKSAVRVIRYAADAGMLLTGCDDGFIRWWDLGERRIVKESKAHEGRVWFAELAKNGKFIISCGEDSRIVRLDAASLTKIADTNVQRPTCACANWIHDEIAVGFRNSIEIIAVNDLRSKQKISIQLGDSSVVSTMAWANNRRFLAVSGSGQSSTPLIIIDMESGKQATYSIPGGKNTVLSALTFVGDGDVLACGTSDGNVLLFQCETKAFVDWRGDAKAGVTSICYGTFEKTIVSGHNDTTLSRWEVTMKGRNLRGRSSFRGQFGSEGRSPVKPGMVFDL